MQILDTVTSPALCSSSSSFQPSPSYFVPLPLFLLQHHKHLLPQPSEASPRLSLHTRNPDNHHTIKMKLTIISVFALSTTLSGVLGAPLPVAAPDSTMVEPALVADNAKGDPYWCGAPFCGDKVSASRLLKPHLDPRRFDADSGHRRSVRLLQHPLPSTMRWKFVRPSITSTTMITLAVLHSVTRRYATNSSSLPFPTLSA